MELDDLLRQFDIASANLVRLDQVWQRARVLIPDELVFSNDPEYDELRRQWADLIDALPPVDGQGVTVELPELTAIARWRLDAMDIGEFREYADVEEAIEEPGRALGEYRHRLRRARRRAISRRAEELVPEVDQLVPQLSAEYEGDQSCAEDVRWLRLRDIVRELDRLVGDSASRHGRWREIRRHLAWGQGKDAYDIANMDWPSVKKDIEAAIYPDVEPLPSAGFDLGIAAAYTLSGGASVQLDWEALDDDGFERLLFDLLRESPGYKNVQWLTRTHAPDGGRDVSADKVSTDSTGLTRIERVIVQARHWLSKSLGAPDVSAAAAQCQLWEPPPVHVLIIATSGRFTSDAWRWIDGHNNEGRRPFIDPWPENRLEALLAARPHIAVAHHLR